MRPFWDESGSMRSPVPATMKVWAIKLDGKITHYVLLAFKKTDVEIAGLVLHGIGEGVTVDEMEIPHERFEALMLQSERDQNGLSPKVISFVHFHTMSVRRTIKPINFQDKNEVDPLAWTTKVFGKQSVGDLIIFTDGDFDGRGKTS